MSKQRAPDVTDPLSPHRMASIGHPKERAMSAEARLKELGLVLPVLPKPMANYLPYRLVGNVLYLSGQGPRDEKGNSLTGKLGADVSLEEGYRRARLVGD